MRYPLLTLALILAAANPGAAEEGPYLLQQPALSRTQIAFVLGGDLWTVPRVGGEAQRLTTGAGLETNPVFSPDGKQLAFAAEYAGNLDVYVIPAAGGVPKRLTYHPGVDVPVGWTPDGKNVLFRSGRSSYSPRFDRLFTIPVDGGHPTELPLPMGEEGAYSPDGKRLAYVPFWNRRPVPYSYIAWKRYRGGLASPIWIAELSDSRVEKVPRTDSNDWNPLWIGAVVYFLSDRDGPAALYAYDTRTQKVERVVAAPDGGDFSAAAAAEDAIAIEQFGKLHLYDLAKKELKPVPVHVTGDFAGVRPRYEKITKQIRNANLSPTGARAVFEARGEIVTVPAEKGDARNLTHTPGVAERDPAWSPDGKTIAYFSDEAGEYALHLRDQRGQGEVKKIPLGDPPSFFYSPAWSPDGSKIAYHDKRLKLWYVDVAEGKPVHVDTDNYDKPTRTLDPSWSPDGKWLAYTKQLPSHLRAVFLYSVANRQSRQITDGMSDARYAVWDKNGKYLYFTASTDVGPTTGWLDMSSFNRPVTRSVYVVVLAKDQPSPLAPESDDEKEKAKEEKKDEKLADVKIDAEGIGQRVLALPVPARNYAGMWAGKTGVLFLAEVPAVMMLGQQAGAIIHKFDLATRKSDKYLEGTTTFKVSHNGEKALYRQGDKWFIVSAAAPPKPGDGALNLDGVEIRVEPRAEWRQMYREAWRIQRDYLYDPQAHGLDLQAAAKKYEPYLEHLVHRADLNYLFNEMLSELVLGHTYVNGGDLPEVPRIPGGLLGADYRIADGRYQFARVYDGENWNPQLRAPLTQPGVGVQAGEYLLAVAGKELKASDSIYQAFEATAGKAVILKVGPKPDGTEAREVTVVPVESEVSLRYLAWIEDNRRKVDRLTDGKVAYVHLPNTAGEGFTNFNRYFFAQVGKQGVVLDERFNGGGTAADYFIDYLRRPLLSYWTTREGADFTTPVGAIFGPKAMLINEFAGSGGDALPWYFRRAKVGPLIGKRTWGGLVGIYDYPQLIDGGAVTAPRLAFWNPEGQWEVENHGVAPDIEVDLDPYEVRKGRDPQLEKAVDQVLEGLRKNPPATPKRPEYPNYYPEKGKATGAKPQAADRAGVVKALEGFIRREVKEKEIPALSIALVDDQQIVWEMGFGAGKADSVYRVASVSKLFNAVAVMQAVERGQLDLDAPITQYLPEFAPKPKGANDKPITLRMLLSHRSGLVRETPVGSYFDTTSPPLADMVRSLNQTTLVYEPGSKTSYSNAGVALAGYVLERQTGEPFAERLRRQVLAPFGMAKSGFAETPDLRHDLAPAIMWTYHGRTFPAPQMGWTMVPAGGLYATAPDLGHFLSGLFRGGEGPGGRVLKPETLAKMWEPQFEAPGTKRGFGLGFALGEFEGHQLIRHDGALYGYATTVAGLPGEKLGVVVCASKDCANAVTERIAQTALRCLLAVRNGKPLPAMPETAPIPPERMQALTGRYADDKGAIELEERAGRLYAWNLQAGKRAEVRQAGDDLAADDCLDCSLRLKPTAEGLKLGDRLLKRVPERKPDPVPAKWAGLIGEYGWDHNTLYVLEKDGKLWALIEWFFLYPLTETGPDQFRFPDFGLYHGDKVVFHRGADGRADRAEAASVVFPRRIISGETPGGFRIRPVKPVSELRQAAQMASPPKEAGFFREPELVELNKLDPTIKLDVRYATTDNFLGVPVYTEARAFLQRPAAEALVRAHQKLAAQGYGLLIHDGYRPWSVTKMFWDATPPENHLFVADPSQGSRHNRGCAVDLTLYDRATGKPVVMTGGYDEFSDRSYPEYPGGTDLQRWHRELLRRTMEAEGFTVYLAEWWHFDYRDWRKYPILNVPFAEVKR